MLKDGSFLQTVPRPRRVTQFLSFMTSNGNQTGYDSLLQFNPDQHEAQFDHTWYQPVKPVEKKLTFVHRLEVKVHI